MPDLELLQKKFNKRINRKVTQERTIYIAPRSDGNLDKETFNHHGIKRNYKKYREGQK